MNSTFYSGSPIHETRELANELHTINRVLERVRTQAYLGQTPKLTGRALDDLHYLLNGVMESLNGEPFDRERFVAYLQLIEKEYDGCEGIVARYEEDAKYATMSGKK